MTHENISTISLLTGAVFIAVAVIGCEPLHRDVEPRFDHDVGVDATADQCVDGRACGPCDQGETVCEDTGAVCQGAVDLETDDDNCGECGEECTTGVDVAKANCEAGSCEVECPEAGQTACEEAGVCVDLETDDDHCGECGEECSTEIEEAQASCESGVCEVECDDPDETPCFDDFCADLQTDADNCGECGNSCPGPHDCVEGSC